MRSVGNLQRKGSNILIYINDLDRVVTYLYVLTYWVPAQTFMGYHSSFVTLLRTIYRVIFWFYVLEAATLLTDKCNKQIMVC